MSCSAIRFRFPDVMSKNSESNEANKILIDQNLHYMENGTFALEGFRQSFVVLLNELALNNFQHENM